MMDSFLYELKRSARTLLRRPRYLLSVSLPLALALSGSAVMFALVWGVLLEPLPYRSPGELVQIWERNTERGNDQTAVTIAEFYDWKSLASFSDLAAYAGTWSATMSDRGDPRSVTAQTVTYNLFDTLGLTPAHGRFFSAEDELDEAEVVVLSEQFATELFGSSEAAVGERLTIQGSPQLILGVVPGGQGFPNDNTDLWVPTVYSERSRQDRKAHQLYVVARLSSGSTLGQAQAELDTAMASIRADYPELKTGEDAFVVPLHEEMVGGVRTQLFVLLAAVSILLLIAIANVSGLALARVRQRRIELALRSSLGASRMRVAAPVVMESTLLALLAGLIAIPIAKVGVRFAAALTREWVPRVLEVDIGWGDAFGCIAVAAAAGLAVGIVSSMVALREGATSALRGSGRVSGSVTRDRVRATAVVAQVAMSFVLLAGAAILVRSMHELLSTDTGYNTKEVLTVDVSLPYANYPDIATQNEFFRQLVEKAGEIPGVESSGATSGSPVTGNNITRSYHLEGDEVRAEAERKTYEYRAVTPGYFGTMGIALQRGRDFGSSDRDDTSPVMIVNEAFAREASPDKEVLGRRVSFNGLEGPWLEIVGVVGDTRESGPESEPVPMLFAPYTQRTWTWLNWMTLVLRVDGDATQYVGSIRNQIRALDPSLPVDEVMTIEQHIKETLGKRRFQMLLLASFAALALILTLVGVYALMSNALAMRTKEIGVRLALGAGPSDVVKLFTREGMTLVVTGVGVGLVLAVLMTRFLEAMVVRVSPTDPLSLAGAALSLVAATALACWLPARRARHVEPATVLRSE